MVSDFLITYTKLLAQHPEKVRLICEEQHESHIDITIETHQDDVSRVIGKRGNMIKAIRNVMRGCAYEHNQNTKVTILPAS